jgi:hypothetical protein
MKGMTDRDNLPPLIATTDPEVRQIVKWLREVERSTTGVRFKVSRDGGKWKWEVTALNVSSRPNLGHFLLHFFVPRSDRQIVERDLEEQFEEEASDPRLGLRQARMLYCKRVADNVLAYTWGRLPKRVRTIILSSITGWVLKTFGLLPTLAALKDLGVLPWK